MASTKRTIATRICQRCGQEFHPISGRLKTQKYCSIACRDVPRIPLRELSPEQIAWLAGILDGEGNIQINARLGPRHSGVRITITNTSRPLLERIFEITGVGYIATKAYDNPKWRTRYNWIINGATARQILQLLLPWLIVKRDVALAALHEDASSV